jgi:hypothetical protein
MQDIAIPADLDRRAARLQTGKKLSGAWTMPDGVEIVSIQVSDREGTAHLTARGNGSVRAHLNPLVGMVASRTMLAWIDTVGPRIWRGTLMPYRKRFDFGKRLRVKDLYSATA